jgi:hypothetical protein
MAVVGPTGHPIDRDFVFDFGHLNWVKGSGLTVLCNILDWLLLHKVQIGFVNFQQVDRPSLKYLDDCGFLKNYMGSAISAYTSPRSSALPCRKVSHAHSFQWLEGEFSWWMASSLSVGRNALGSVRNCVKELFNNIQDHSTLQDGFVHCQLYPRLDWVEITLSDFGRGIPDTIRPHFGQMSDPAAIAKAIEPGVTTKSHRNNMGVGLDVLTTYVTGNYGTVTILSAHGMVKCGRAPDGTPTRAVEFKTGRYPGTLVEIGLSARRFVGDSEETEVVEW